ASTVSPSVIADSSGFWNTRTSGDACARGATADVHATTKMRARVWLIFMTVMADPVWSEVSRWALSRLRAPLRLLRQQPSRQLLAGARSRTSISLRAARRHLPDLHTGDFRQVCVDASALYAA